MEDSTIEIRENIRHRQVAGELPADPDIVINTLPGTGGTNNSFESLKVDLDYLCSNGDILNNASFFCFHHPHIGKYLNKWRQLMHGVVRRYVDLIFLKQVEWNTAASRTFQSLEQTMVEVRDKNQSLEQTVVEVRDKNQSLEQTMVEVRDKNQSLEQTMVEVRDKNLSLEQTMVEVRDKNLSLEQTVCEVRDEVRDEVSLQLKNMLLAADDEIEKRTWLSQLIERNNEQNREMGEYDRIELDEGKGTGINYFVFEDKFRGSRTTIKERQQAFLPYFEGCRNVLDIGCGRGEFLEMMKDNNISSIGIDIDLIMLNYCNARGFEVIQADALTYLEGLEDMSLDGIFIDQVIEHLEPKYFMRMLEACIRKLKFGFYLVAETVNPLSFFSFANFYIDMTHIRPVHPQTLRFLLEYVGFRETEIQFHSPVPDEIRLKYLPINEIANDQEKVNSGVYNQNINMLNGILFGAQDYSVVGKK